MMVRTPDASEDLFAEAATNWDLQKLYKDLAVAKREFAPHKKRELTQTEKKHLRGLLCRYSPAEMAKKLYKNYRGVEADLCSTIYRYVEQLTKKPLNTLKNWRDIPEWSAIGSLIEVTTTNTIATGLDIDINTTTEIDIAIDYISAIAISRTIATSTAINIYIPDVIFNAITITLDDILKENTNSEFKEKIEKLKNYLPISNRDTFKQWWLNNGFEWTKKLRNVIINYRDIGQDWQFTEAQKKLLVQYYQANKFLMECLNSGCNVSPEVRSHIEDNLFLPLNSSLS